MFPNLRRAVRVDDFPNIDQTRMPQPDDAEKVMEEVEEWPPAEVGMLLSENPVGWYLANPGYPVVGVEVSS